MAGIMLLPGDRKREALMPVLGVRVNATIQSLRRFSVLGFLRRRGSARAVEGLRRAARDPHAVARATRPVPLGGQPAEGRGRAVFLREPIVILAYEPTQGVDVGSRFDIYAALRSRTDAGTALL